MKNQSAALSGFPCRLDSSASKLLELERKAWDAFALGGFRPVSLPSVERSALFRKAVGGTSDIAKKELYELVSEDGFCLRPEGTAGCVRSWLVDGAANLRQSRLAYCGSMFRAERSQAGRQREFRQFGLEGLGIPFGAFDIELVALCDDFLDSVGSVRRLKVNWIGSAQERSAYCAALSSWLQGKTEGWSAVERERAALSPLRLWDAPSDEVAQALIGAPRLQDFISQTGRDSFSRFTRGLVSLGISFDIDESLVRGLDYYNGPVFEWVDYSLGRPLSICGGGRYDGLCKTLGGADSPAAGCAFGLERVMLSIPGEEISPARSGSQFCWGGDEAMFASLSMARAARKAGGSSWVDSAGGGWGKQVGRADALGAASAVFVGERELASGSVTVKDLVSGEQSARTIVSPKT